MTLTVNDMGNTGSGGPKEDSLRVNITVNAVNDPPIFTVPFTSTTEFLTSSEDAIYTLPGLTVDDVDGTDIALRELKIDTSVGKIIFTDSTDLSYLECTEGSLCQNITVRGTLTSLKNALQHIEYRPPGDWNGPVLFSLWTFDAGIFGYGENGTDEAVVHLRINAVADVPTVTAADVTGVEEQILEFSISAALTDTDGSEFISSIVLSGFQSGDGVLQGPLINNTRATLPLSSDGSVLLTAAQLRGLCFLPVFVGERTINVVVTSKEKSNGNSATAHTSFSMTVTTFNDGPLLSGDWVDGSATMFEDEIYTISGGFSFYDPDAANNIVKVTLSSTAGAIQLSDYAGLTAAGVGTTTLTLQGTISQLNSAFGQDIIYDPPAQWNGVDTVTILFSDEGYSGQRCPAGSCGSAQRCDVCIRVNHAALDLCFMYLFF